MASSTATPLPSSSEELEALIRRILRNEIGLAREPRPVRAKELRGKPGFFRLWIAGDWRLVYRFSPAVAP